MLNQVFARILPKESNWALFELILLTLCLLALPSLEAPKNIFLWLYLIIATSNRLIEFIKIKKWGIWDSMFLFLLVSIILAGTGAPLPGSQNLSKLADPISGVLLAWTIARANYQAKTAKLLIGVAILSVIPPLIHGLWQFYISHQKSSLELHSVGHVNHSAIYLSILFGASLSYLAACWDSKKWWLTPLTLILLIAVIISDSRAAVGMSFFIGVILLALLFKRSLKLIGIGILATIFAIMVNFNAPVVKKQIANQEANNVLSSRDRVWNVSLEAMKMNPIFGVGLSQWSKVTPQVIEDQLRRKNIPYIEENYFYAGHGHSLYMNTLAERGILGGTSLLFLMLLWSLDLIKTYKTSKNNCLLWGSSFTAWLVVFGIGLANTTNHHEHGLLGMLILGLYINYSTSLERKT